VIEQGSVTSKVLADRKATGFALDWMIHTFDQSSPDFSDRMDLPLHAVRAARHHQKYRCAPVLRLNQTLMFPNSRPPWPFFCPIRPAS
jgi:hypothetical protein